MSWALFQRAHRSPPLWLATASGFALLASPAVAQQAGESLPAQEVAGEPDLQTPDIAPVTTDAPAVAAEDPFVDDDLDPGLGVETAQELDEWGLFVERHGCTIRTVASKKNASAPAPSATLTQVAQEVDFLITGLGD